MSRPIINADEHLASLGKRSQRCIGDAVKYITFFNPQRVHLYEQDIDCITADLRGSGFDLGRGFKVCGVKVVSIENS